MSSSYYHNDLNIGDRVFLKGKGAATIERKDYRYYDDDDYYGGRNSRNSSTYNYQIKFDKGDGTDVQYLKDESDKYSLYENLIYTKDHGFNIGDTFEVEREGLEPNLRGRLLEIDAAAEMWPYKIGQEYGVSVWFGIKEIRKIHSVISQERAPKAKEVLKEQIARTRAELEALETALEVLEYAS